MHSENSLARLEFNIENPMNETAHSQTQMFYVDVTNVRIEGDQEGIVLVRDKAGVLGREELIATEMWHDLLHYPLYKDVRAPMRDLAERLFKQMMELSLINDALLSLPEFVAPVKQKKLGPREKEAIYRLRESLLVNDGLSYSGAGRWNGAFSGTLRLTERGRKMITEGKLDRPASTCPSNCRNCPSP